MATTSAAQSAAVLQTSSGSANPAAEACEASIQNTKVSGNGARVTYLHSAVSVSALGKETVVFHAVVGGTVLLLVK